MRPKPIFLDGAPLATTARTTWEVAELLRAAGVKINPGDAYERSRHIAEGPDGFHATREERR